MTDHQMQIDMVEVKAEDIIADRRAMYDSFITATVWSIGATIVLLVLIYLFFG
ncbi:aa3-type cytochrome c oxidase subunit IV [Roseococcus sp. SYP-B2431]|uniref:aa3-type cytochrome c oxidase subunit IV n=1 Tax=Roseococcus sp. SYP-B2431 TaxID=2496640 RepID=UPI00103875B7|nr:aa3-type cytochrome c oxidase subunit IV [Roseococcus sp. SYP-B2431]TCH96022.1 aa3-type cytochrome c oxidase subunit IV [Roseococcus sp. SYP-B2431]